MESRRVFFVAQMWNQVMKILVTSWIPPGYMVVQLSYRPPADDEEEAAESWVGISFFQGSNRPL